jgi:hypothetical protein
VLLMRFILLVRRNSRTGFFFASHRYKLHCVAAESLGLCNGTYVRLYRIVAAECCRGRLVDVPACPMFVESEAEFQSLRNVVAG